MSRNYSIEVICVQIHESQLSYTDIYCYLYTCMEQLYKDKYI